MNRNRWVAVLGLWLLAGGAGAAEVEVLGTQQQKLSYAMGVSMARTFSRQHVEVDADLLARGVRDGLAGRGLLLDDAELRRLVAELQGEVRQRATKAMQSAAEAKSQGEAFLAGNAKQEGVVTLASGLQYKVLRAGTGATPKVNDKVRCHYRGTLIDGTEFDNTVAAGRPAVINLARAIPGWREALLLMPVGSKWQVFIPPQLAYGERGARGRKNAHARIGPNATLVFEAELLGIQPTAATAALVEPR